jgi:hypothetical protein
VLYDLELIKKPDQKNTFILAEIKSAVVTNLKIYDGEVYVDRELMEYFLYKKIPGKKWKSLKDATAKEYVPYDLCLDNLHLDSEHWNLYLQAFKIFQRRELAGFSKERLADLITDVNKKLFDYTYSTSFSVLLKTSTPLQEKWINLLELRRATGNLVFQKNSELKLLEEKKKIISISPSEFILADTYDELEKLQRFLADKRHLRLMVSKFMTDETTEDWIEKNAKDSYVIVPNHYVTTKHASYHCIWDLYEAEVVNIDTPLFWYAFNDCPLHILITILDKLTIDSDQEIVICLNCAYISTLYNSGTKLIFNQTISCGVPPEFVTVPARKLQVKEEKLSAEKLKKLNDPTVIHIYESNQDFKWSGKLRVGNLYIIERCSTIFKLTDIFDSKINQSITETPNEHAHHMYHKLTFLPKVGHNLPVTTYQIERKEWKFINLRKIAKLTLNEIIPYPCCNWVICHTKKMDSNPLLKLHIKNMAMKGIISIKDET